MRFTIAFSAQEINFLRVPVNAEFIVCRQSILFK